MRRSSNRGLTAIPLSLACTFLANFALSPAADGADSKNPALDAIVKRLDKQERLVKSCECLLSYRTDPTSPEMIPLIEEHCRKTGQSRDRYIPAKQNAARESHVLHWWRHGDKERFDRFRSFEAMNASGAKPLESEAFDGKLTRTFNTETGPYGTKGPVYCSIRSGKEALLTIDRYPFAFLYEYGDRRYSELLAQARDAQIMEVDGQTKVTFTRAHGRGSELELVFAADGSLLNRYKIAKGPRDAAPRIYERHSFSGYRTYQAASGESIWFPSEIDFEGVLGTTGDGRLIVYSHEHVQVNSLQFNHQIPDEVFVIQFPEGCEVHDRTARRPRQNAK
jgi:hypothetical protein